MDDIVESNHQIVNNMRETRTKLYKLLQYQRNVEMNCTTVNSIDNLQIGDCVYRKGICAKYSTRWITSLTVPILSPKKGNGCYMIRRAENIHRVVNRRYLRPSSELWFDF